HDHPAMITLGALNDLAGVRHGFLTRAGGVSEGIYASLNCGYGAKDDPPDRVAENRARALARADLPAGSLVTAYQVHSARVARVERPWPREDAPEVDAMVTDRPGVTLGILTADCAPVLFADAPARVIGAAHAGWRGAQGGVLEATVAAMVELGAERARIRAGIGPCIAQRSYEVGPDFPKPFLADDPANAAFFCPSRREGHFMFDLPGYVAARLAAAGLRRVCRLPHDTCAEAERFFSYRRATLRGEPDYGRGLSLIGLVEEE
uniref:peptidoglycan editing factor PgeF n=1 Tax=Falsiroseomonas sp. TaxID=2870721 RepID=UPI0035639FEA